MPHTAAFDFRKPVAYDEDAKRRFHNAARRQLRRLASALALNPFDLRSNKAGIAIAGDVTLHGERLYVQVSQTALSDVHGVRFRTCNGRRDFVGGATILRPSIFSIARSTSPPRSGRRSMFNARTSFSRIVTRPLSVLPHRPRSLGKRLLRAWRYAFQTLSEDDAQTIILDCEPAAGWRALLTLADAGVLEQARTLYADHPALNVLVAEACTHVARKWENHSDDLHQAESWALDLVAQYATDLAINLVPLDASPSFAHGDTPL
jgi:hypothetical protein